MVCHVEYCIYTLCKSLLIYPPLLKPSNSPNYSPSVCPTSVDSRTSSGLSKVDVCSTLHQQPLITRYESSKHCLLFVRKQWSAQVVESRAAASWHLNPRHHPRPPLYTQSSRCIIGETIINPSGRSSRKLLTILIRFQWRSRILLFSPLLNYFWMLFRS